MELSKEMCKSAIEVLNDDFMLSADENESYAVIHLCPTQELTSLEGAEDAEFAICLGDKKSNLVEGCITALFSKEGIETESFISMDEECVKEARMVLDTQLAQYGTSVEGLLKMASELRA